MQKENAGVLCIATKNPYYGKMAYNLAMTIKAADRATSIAVLHNGAGLSHLTAEQLKIFDHIIRIPDETGGIRAKLSMYEYTPFDRTLYIDADNIWINEQSPLEFINSIDCQTFTGITEGRIIYQGGAAGRMISEFSSSYVSWMDAADTMNVYDIAGTMYQWRSEVLFFCRTPHTEKFFNKAIEVYEKPLVQVQRFADGLPDEYAIGVAAALMDIHPHLYKWQPAYWFNLSGEYLDARSIIQQYAILSTGGKGFNSYVKNLYDSFVGAAAYKLRLRHLFKLRPKQTVISERYKL